MPATVQHTFLLQACPWGGTCPCLCRRVPCCPPGHGPCSCSGHDHPCAQQQSAGMTGLRVKLSKLAAADVHHASTTRNQHACGANAAAPVLLFPTQFIHKAHGQNICKTW